MAKKTVAKKGMSAGSMVAIGAGVAALSAGAYYFLGPNGKKNQKHAKAWMAEMKSEAMKKIAKVEKVTMPLYNKAVDNAAAMYAKQYKAHAPEINAFAKKLKSEWKGAEQKAKPVVKKVQKAVKKIEKKVMKKINAVKKSK